MKKLICAAAIALRCAIPAWGQSVQLAPLPVQTFFSGSGAPLAGGFVYFYNNGTTVPAPTYTDSSGTILNTNPVQLDSAGRAQIWLAQQTYTECVADANNLQQFCVNGVSSGANLLALTNTWTNPQTWQALGTFQNGIGVTNGVVTDTLNAASGIGVCGAPVSLTGGINFNPGCIISVSNATLLTLNAGNLGIAGGAALSGQLTSTVATGTAPLVIASTTNVPNLNASSLNGATFAAPGPIGSGTPSTIAGSSIADTGLTIGGCVQVGALNVLTTPSSTPCLNPAVSSVVLKNLASGTSLVASTTKAVDTQTVTMPTSGCPCRVLVSYTYFNHAPSGGSTPGTIAFWVSDGISSFAMSEISVSSVSDGQANSGSGTSASFANSAVATITVNARADTAQTIDQHDLVGAGLNSNLQLTVVTSQ